MNAPVTDRRWLTLLFEILVIVGVSEASVMMVLPEIAPDVSEGVGAILDAGLLTVISAPLLLWRFLKSARSEGSDATQSLVQKSSLRGSAAVLLVGIVLSGVAAYEERVDTMSLAQSRFDQRVDNLQTDVKAKFDQAVDGLNAMNGLYNTQRRISRADFNNFWAPTDLNQRFPGIRSFGLMEHVKRSEIRRFTEAERLDGAPDFDVSMLGLDSDLFVVRHVVSTDSLPTAMGRNVSGEAIRSAAIHKAIQTGTPTLSGSVKLMPKNGESKVGFLYVKPVVLSDTRSLGTKQPKLPDLVFATVVLDELLKEPHRALQGQANFSLYGGQQVTGNTLLMDTESWPVTDLQTKARNNAVEARFTSLRTMQIGGQTLALKVISTPTFDATVDSAKSAIVGTAGLVLTLFASMLAWLLSRGQELARAQANRMTEEVKMLARVVQVTNASVILTDSEQRIKWVNEGFTRICGISQSDAVGHRPFDLRGTAHTDPLAAAKLQSAFDVGSDTLKLHVHNQTFGGRDYWLDVDIHSVQSESGSVTGYILVETDITEEIKDSQRLTNALRSTESLMNTINVHSIVSEADRHGRIIDVNEAFVESSGYSRFELIGSDHRIVNSGVQSQAFWSEMWNCVGSGQPWRGEICNRSKNGNLYWVDSLIAPFTDASGKIQRYVSIRTDITQRKLNEQKLAESEAFLAMSNRISGAGAWRLILNDRTMQWSAETKRIHDVSEDFQPTLAKAIGFYTVESRGRISDHIEHAIDSGSPWDDELQIATAKGRTLWVRVQGEIEQVEGKTVALVGALQDITQERQAREALRASQEKLQALFELSPVGMTRTTMEGMFLEANQAFENMTGYSTSELPSMGFGDITPTEYAASDIDFIQNVINHSYFGPHEKEFVHKDGHAFPVRQSALCIRASDGQAFVWTIVEDISAQKSYEQTLQHARHTAELASASKGMFVANMSHEIRTPMNAILGMLKLLQTTELSANQFDYASKAEVAAQSLLSLLNDILDFSKVEAGKLVLENQVFRFDKLMRDLAVILSTYVGNKNIEVLYDIAPSLPPLLMGDAMRLQQVLINLCGNAIKFTSQGQVVVSIKIAAPITSANSDNVALSFAVQDTGIGIAVSNQAHIFTGFSQAEASTTRKFGGTGLGLAISKHLVEAMGGKLELESTLGVGSTFSFDLNFPVVAQLPDGSTDNSPPIKQAGSRRVLIVEDNPISMRLLEIATKSWGWPTTSATSGEQAIELIAARSIPQAFPFDVIYMDWYLPGIDGWETILRIRQMSKAIGSFEPSIVMISSNARGSLEQRTQAEQNMINGFLVKPVTASMLLEATLDQQSSSARLRKTRRTGASKRRLAGMRVLVAEDNQINQQVAEELLMSEGARVTLAANGQIAVDALAANQAQFDVVLMDIQMPIMDGYTATRYIRETLAMTKLPIVAMTANALESDRNACIAAGMNEHVGKPFDLDNLVDVLLHTCQYLVPEPLSSSSNTALLRHEESTKFNAKSDVDWDRDGIEVKRALARMGGMNALYARTAREFARSLPKLISIYQVQIQTSAWKDAAAQMHTLKGMAGTVGAARLAELAREGEKLFSNEADLVAARLHADQLEAEAQASAEALQAIAKAMHPEEDPHHAENQWEGALKALRELITMLEAEDFGALEKFANERHRLDSLPAEQMQSLELALQDLDMETACRICVELVRSIDLANRT